MRCQKCSAENPPGAKFCIQCAASFQRRCSACAFDNPPEAKFCAECATPLAEPPPAAALGTRDHADHSGDALWGERRHLTVLFCDLVGSTSIAARLDPEEWRGIVSGCHQAAAQEIERFGGYVAQYLGDGVMAYFGWRAAHDNDAERAARAGLAILEGVAKLNQQSGTGLSPSSSVRLSAWVGIDSGTVVVGAGKVAEVFGYVPNIAARVQAVADPDTVLITAATHRLISGLFVVEKTGARELKGVPSAIELFCIVRPMGVRGRLGAARSLTPFVGREDELRLLLSRWERAREGEGQMVLVVGEAGIGKSRLVAEFHQRIRDTPHIWMESAGEQLFENTPFHSISRVLSQCLELQGDADSGESARAHSGRTTEGMALIRSGIDELLKVGNRITVTASITTLAEAQKLAGSIAEALDTIEWALQFNPDELFNRPETHRLRGELRLESGQSALAEADFRDSIPLARSMGAKAWALRRTTSLARLLKKQGRRDEASTMLTKIYNWFTEGFDTPDLRDVKALLDELQS